MSKWDTPKQSELALAAFVSARGFPNSNLGLEVELRPIGATRVCSVENVPERIAEWWLGLNEHCTVTSE